MRASRIPVCSDYSYDGMVRWFSEMSDRDFLFHPDDDPGDLVWLKNDKKMFTKREADEAREIIYKMFRRNGDAVYDAAHDIFVIRLGIDVND